MTFGFRRNQLWGILTNICNFTLVANMTESGKRSLNISGRKMSQLHDSLREKCERSTVKVSLHFSKETIKFQRLKINIIANHDLNIKKKKKKFWETIILFNIKTRKPKFWSQTNFSVVLSNSNSRSKQNLNNRTYFCSSTGFPLNLGTK